MMGQYNADSLADRAATSKQMLQQGFGQAQQAANQNFANNKDCLLCNQQKLSTRISWCIR